MIPTKLNENIKDDKYQRFEVLFSMIGVSGTRPHPGMFMVITIDDFIIFDDSGFLFSEPSTW